MLLPYLLSHRSRLATQGAEPSISRSESPPQLEMGSPQQPATAGHQEVILQSEADVSREDSGPDNSSIAEGRDSTSISGMHEDVNRQERGSEGASTSGASDRAALAEAIDTAILKVQSIFLIIKRKLRMIMSGSCRQHPPANLQSVTKC